MLFFFSAVLPFEVQLLFSLRLPVLFELLRPSSPLLLLRLRFSNSFLLRCFCFL